MVKVHLAWRVRHAKCTFTMLGVNRVMTVAGVTPKPDVTPVHY